METLEQKTVNRVYITSYKRKGQNDSVKFVGKQFFAGIFPPHVTKPDIEAKLDQYSLWDKVLGDASLSEEKPYRIEFYPNSISVGQIFDDVDEFAKYLSHGITYEDILSGHKLAKEEVGL